MRTILVLCLMNLFAFQAIFSIDGFSQSCNNSIQDGDEFRKDCGGSLCADCIPLLYKVECEDGVGETGVFELSVYLPNYLWTDDALEEYFYEFGGDLNIECYTLNECQGFANYVEGNQAQVFIYKRSIPDQELLGYGSITGELYCVKSDLTPISCPASLDLNVSATYEKIPLDDSDSHMLKIEISGGTPPYSIRDNNNSNTDDLFYKIGITESTYYLGAFPNGVELDLDIIDINECVAPIFSSDGNDCISGYSIAVANTTLNCEGNDLESGTIILKDQGSCNQTLEFNGMKGDTIRGLASGSYTFNLLNLSNNTMEEQTRIISTNENNVNPFSVYPTLHDLEAKVQFCLDSESRVTLSAYAANGQYLGTVISNEVLDGGGHLYSSFTSGFPSGVYFYALEIEGEDMRVVRTVKL